MVSDTKKNIIYQKFASNHHVSLSLSLSLSLSHINNKQVKAQIVSALKAMTHNLNYGDQVSHILNSNPIWAEYRDQKHDLFITDSNVRGYLTGKHFLFSLTFHSTQLTHFHSILKFIRC